MYELRKKIREYKNSESFQAEPQKNGTLDNLWDYDISLSEDSHPFHASYLAKEIRRAAEAAEAADLGPSDFQDIFAKECYGSDGILSSILSAEHVDGDWLNGMIFAHEIIPKLSFNQFSATINSWHSGCDTGLLRGFNHFCKASRYSGHKKIDWTWLGMDIKSDFAGKHGPPVRLSNSIIGAVGNSDVLIGSNLVNISNIVKERCPEGMDIIFHDIYPHTPHVMISGVIMSIMVLSSRGYFICRLPDPNVWTEPVIDVMLMISMIFKKINLWRPSWGRSHSGGRKTYLVARGMKKTPHKLNYRNFLHLLKSDLIGCQFIKQSIYDEKVRGWHNICQNIKLELTESGADEASSPATVAEWVELLTSSLTALPESKKVA